MHSLSITGCSRFELAPTINPFETGKSIHTLSLSSIHIENDQLEMIFIHLYLSSLQLNRIRPLSNIRVPKGYGLKNLQVRGCVHLESVLIEDGDRLEHIACSNNPRLRSFELSAPMPCLRTLSLRSLPLVVSIILQHPFPALALFQVKPRLLVLCAQVIHLKVSRGVKHRRPTPDTLGTALEAYSLNLDNELIQRIKGITPPGQLVVRRKPVGVKVPMVRPDRVGYLIEN